MAARVTTAEVKEILSTTLADDALSPFVQAANLTITAILGASTVLSAAQLKEIERWYAAHLIACTLEQQAQAEGAGDARITYQGETGKDLDSTRYGQVVKQLDVSGVFAAGLGRRKASVLAVTSFA